MSRRVNNDSLPLLLATTELDAWVRATAASLAEERASPGAIDLQNSRLGRWLANEGARLYGGSPAFLAMRRMQQQGQALVVQLSAQQAGGDLAAAQQTVSELQTLVTHIGGQLGGLMRMNAPEEEALPT